MRTFIFGDMHGRWDFLEKLLQAAGIMDEDGQVMDKGLVISIGDLINGTMMDINNDTEMITKAKDVVDLWVAGNHEACYTFPHLGFQGFVPSPIIQTEYNGWMRSGKLVPCVQIGELLITHAGVNKAFAFNTAKEAHDAIWDVWENYFQFADPIPGGSRPLGKPEPWQFKGQRYQWSWLLDGITHDRGGNAAVGGVLWDDWSQPKNTNFSQIMGHTPIKTGPVIHRHLGSGVFTLNLDCGAKKGMTPYGVWVDDDGQTLEFVTVEVDDAQPETS